jgi:undecaprenyl-diphosphatase
LIVAVFAGDLWGLLSVDGRAFDVATYHAIHDTYRAPWLDRTMETASKIGETKSGLYGLAFFAFFGTPTAQVTAKLAAVSLIGSGGISQVTKWVVNRERPDGAGQRHNSSFPSQHATGAAAVAVLVSHRHGRLGAFAWALALWIGLSRIYLGRHYPTDVLTGFLLGAIASWLVLRGERWFEKLHF